MLKYYAMCAASRVRVYYTINPINVMEVWNVSDPNYMFKLRLNMGMLDTFLELTNYVHKRRRDFLKVRAQRKTKVQAPIKTERTEFTQTHIIQ